jgi:hypothetical protein
LLLLLLVVVVVLLLPLLLLGPVVKATGPGTEFSSPLPLDSSKGD